MTSGTPTLAGRRLGPAGVAVAVATALVNAVAYAVPVLGARTLSAPDLSVLATIMALSSIGVVPALALQTALAVRFAREGAVANASRATGWTAAVTAGALIAVSPVVARVLDLPLALALLLAPLTAAPVVASRWLGELQGRQRFGRLAAGLVLLAVGRYAGLVAGLLAGSGVLASVMLAAVGAWLVLPLFTALAHPVLAPGGNRLLGPDIAGAGTATLAMLAVSYADLVLARYLLPPAEAGAYAVGAVLTKGALWAPQMVTVLALPRLAQGSRRALLVAVGLVAACGALLVTASAVAGDLAVRLAGGGGYAGLSPYAAAFAGVGALYAIAFVLVNQELAAAARRRCRCGGASPASPRRWCS